MIVVGHSQLVPESSPQGLAALWGKLVSEILSEAWDEALHNLQKLKIAVDKSFGSALEQLQQRSWMLHWSLFIFFNHPEGQDQLVDFYLACVAPPCHWPLSRRAARCLPRRCVRTVL